MIVKCHHLNTVWPVACIKTDMKSCCILCLSLELLFLISVGKEMEPHSTLSDPGGTTSVDARMQALVSPPDQRGTPGQIISVWSVEDTNAFPEKVGTFNASLIPWGVSMFVGTRDYGLTQRSENLFGILSSNCQMSTSFCLLSRAIIDSLPCVMPLEWRIRRQLYCPIS